MKTTTTQIHIVAKRRMKGMKESTTVEMPPTNSAYIDPLRILVDADLTRAVQIDPVPSIHILL